MVVFSLPNSLNPYGFDVYQSYAHLGLQTVVRTFEEDIDGMCPLPSTEGQGQAKLLDDSHPSEL